MLRNKKRNFFLIGILLFFILVISFCLFFKQNSDLFRRIYKKPKDICWNDIDFEKTERMLLESSIKSKVPFYQYYKNQMMAGKRVTKQQIENDAIYKHIKKKHYNHKPSFVLFYNNGLKAFFKGKRYEYDRLFEAHKNLSGYNISKFLNLKIIPPIVMRKIDGAWGSIQLFVENIKDYPPEYLDGLSSVKKSDIYVYIYLTGYLDLSKGNLLISKKCFLPAVIDLDSITFPSLIQYSKTPFRAFHGDGTVLDRRDYELAPFEKAMSLKSADFESIENTFPGLSF